MMKHSDILQETSLAGFSLKFSAYHSKDEYFPSRNS